MTAPREARGDLSPTGRVGKAPVKAPVKACSLAGVRS